MKSRKTKLKMQSLQYQKHIETKLKNSCAKLIRQQKIIFRISQQK